MVVIMEMRCDPSRLTKSFNIMDYDSIVVAANEGPTGGIVVSWNKQNLKVDMLDRSLQHIHMKVKIEEGK